jgi:hypothetical protein
MPQQMNELATSTHLLRHHHIGVHRLEAAVAPTEAWVADEHTNSEPDGERDANGSNALVQEKGRC